MYKKLIRTLTCLLALLLLLASCSSQTGDPINYEEYGYAPVTKQIVHFGTSSSGSTNHTIASGIANILANNIPEYDLSADVSTGSQENVRLIYSNMLQMCFVMQDVATYGYEGTREFSEDICPEDPFRYVIGSSPTIIQIFVRADSSYHTIEDLKGKRWGAGFGAAYQYYVPIILEAYGMNLSDISLTGMTSADISNALSDSTVDVGVWVAPAGTSAIADVAQTTGIRLIEIDEPTAQKIMEEHTYFSYMEIPQDAYPKLDSSTMALATMNIIIARTDLDENFVYNFTKLVCENGEELALVSPKATEYCLDNVERAMGSIPLHPGAERYYKEIGLIN